MKAVRENGPTVALSEGALDGSTLNRLRVGRRQRPGEARARRSSTKLTAAQLQAWVNRALEARSEQGLGRSITHTTTLDRLAVLLGHEGRVRDSSVA